MFEINNVLLFLFFFIYNFKDLIKTVKHRGVHKLFLVAKQIVEGILESKFKISLQTSLS